MTLQEIKKSLVNVYQGVLNNIVSLANDSTLDKEYKVLKVGEKNTGIELSDDKVKINNLDTNKLTVQGIDVLTNIVDGQILGYTCLDTYTIHYLELSFTVEDASHQVTFVVPPSGNVEIEFTGFFDRTSTSDVTVYASLSDNSTYNALDAKYEYDYNGVKSDDEIDDEIITFKWCVQDLVPGTSTTYYLGLKSSDASAVHLKYGYRSSNGLAFQPFSMKATALPSTIYDGS